MYDIFLYIGAILIPVSIFLGFSYSKLLKEKFEFIRKIQELESENNHLKSNLDDKEKTHKEAFTSAKAALFDLGSDLSKQLLEIHKQENKQSREESGKKAEIESKKFLSEFERIVGLVSELNKDIGESKSTIDVIKQSLLTPTGAGHLAEITLENILKASGLRQGVDFFMQHTIKGEEEKNLRPDAIVKLPGGNVMVVDAKASKFLLEIGADPSKEEEVKLLRSMNQHLKSLSSKEYVNNVIESFNLKGDEIAHAMMLMFLPTEFAVDKVTNIDSAFIQKAWGASIFPVGPSGLMNMLSFARFQINDNMRSQNHNAIIEEVRKIITSLSILTDYSQKVGANIQSLVSNYDKFSASFNRNFLPKINSIQKLGVEASGKKNITSLTRMQIVSSKSQLIDAESIEEEETELKAIEKENS
jgi:DNA recombination protein RmuC